MRFEMKNIKKIIVTMISFFSMTSYASFLNLQDGYYKIKKINHQRIFTDKYEMLVQTDSTDREKKFVAIIPKEILSGGNSGMGYFYQARPVKNGHAYMFSPISIDLNGNFVIDSENSTRSPILLLSKQYDGEKFQMMLQGRNGGMENSLFTVEKKGEKQKYPKLSATPENGVFAAGSKRRGVDLVVFGGMLSLFDNNQISQAFEMVDVNNDFVFSGLTRSEFDSMAEYEVGYEGISKIAMFFETYEGKEQSLLVASPGFRKGQYRMDVYKSGDISWVEKLFINLFE